MPALVVTHSFEEAAMLTGRVAVIERGRIVQQGSARELLESPATPFVAEFAGTNSLPGIADGSVVQLDRGGSVRLAGELRGRVAVLVAPWEITLALQPSEELGPEQLTRPGRAAGAAGQPGAGGGGRTSPPR